MIFGRMGARFPCARDPQASRSLPLSAAINLHEIHLERQSLLQVPVGHIPVPGGIKLCSPGTFLVANYLIINNGSCQVNFTKPKMATIRYTNSQWLPEDAAEASVGRVAVPKAGQKAVTAPPRHEISRRKQGKRGYLLFLQNHIQRRTNAVIIFKDEQKQQS